MERESRGAVSRSPAACAEVNPEPPPAPPTAPTSPPHASGGKAASSPPPLPSAGESTTTLPCPTVPESAAGDHNIWF